MIKKLLDLLKIIEEKTKRIESVFGQTEFLDDISEEIQEIILANFGIPEDNTANYNAEELRKFGKEQKWPKEFYCRDYWYDLLYDFLEGEISKEKMIKELEDYAKNKTGG